MFMLFIRIFMLLLSYVYVIVIMFMLLLTQSQYSKQIKGIASGITEYSS